MLLLAFLLLRALSMIRFVCALVLVDSAGIAHADTGTLPPGQMLEWPRLYIANDSGEFVEPTTPDSLRFYLNNASCACAQAMPDRPQSKIEYELHIQTATGLSKPVLEF